MKNTWGNNLQISLFGESHGPAIGVVIDGLGAGIELDMAFINGQLDKRKPKGKISTQRQEGDQFEIVSGVFQGRTTGTPLCLLIRNQSQHSKDYEATKYLVRPSHADFTAFEKYHGYQDYRGGGHFSGRITAPLVAAGAICLQILRDKGITVASHIRTCKGIEDIPFSNDQGEILQAAALLNERYFPTISAEAGEKMVSLIEDAHKKGDSVGGVLETVVVGMPTAIGEPFFGSVESVLSGLLFSVPAVKGVAFGEGFGFADLYGSEANDAFAVENGKIVTKTNHNGGINGGITNGMPLRIQTVIKPTPSIYQEQDTVDYRKGENAKLTIHGRHDPAIIHRARVVVDSVVAIGLVDLFCERYGYTWMEPKEEKEGTQ
ncbi:MAG: chorismate synthase [Oscillospiraceae bacterium]|nr:chorismate synthase [Oscillospiraceae bacterium]